MTVPSRSGVSSSVAAQEAMRSATGTETWAASGYLPARIFTTPFAEEASTASWMFVAAVAQLS